jgi:SET domain-containing protein
VNGRIFIKAKRNILAGEELNYDYGLVIDEPLTDALKADYPCWCGAKKCRGTLLASSAALSAAPKARKAKKR